MIKKFQGSSRDLRGASKSLIRFQGCVREFQGVSRAFQSVLDEFQGDSREFQEESGILTGFYEGGFKGRRENSKVLSPEAFMMTQKNLQCF